MLVNEDKIYSALNSYSRVVKPAAKADVSNAVLRVNIMNLAGLRVEGQESTILNLTSIKYKLAVLWSKRNA
jgi:hypothetical protein